MCTNNQDFTKCIILCGEIPNPLNHTLEDTIDHYFRCGFQYANRCEVVMVTTEDIQAEIEKVKRRISCEPLRELKVVNINARDCGKTAAHKIDVRKGAKPIYNKALHALKHKKSSTFR